MDMEKYRCIQCNNLYTLGYRVNEQRIRKGLPNYCQNCMKKYKADKISESNKRKYQSDTERSIQISKRAKIRYQNLPQEEKENIKNNLKIMREDFWGSITQEKKDKIYEKVSEKNKEVWSCPEKRKDLSLKLILYWNNLSDEEKGILSIKNSEGQKRKWYKLSDEEKRKKVSQLNHGFVLWWNSISNEDKEIRKQKISDSWNLLSDEDKKHRSEKHRQWWGELDEKGKEAFRISRKEYYNNLSDEEKELWRKRSIDSWKKLPQEEKDRIISARADGVRRFWKNITPEEFNIWIQSHSISNKTNPKDTELFFINELERLKFLNIIEDFHYQYTNQIKYENFNELFPTNPYSKGKCSPYHKWDFKIDLSDKYILIDIDGSIHKLEQSKWIVDGFDVGGYIQFNDSQRPYQTDGLDAYIILAYNDMIEDTTPVLSFQTGEIITYKQLIDLISYRSFSKKELKKRRK